MKGVSGDTDSHNVNVFIAIFRALQERENITAERKGSGCGPLAKQTFPTFCTQSTDNVCPFIRLEDS
jgi:hypothetical protein